MPEQLQTATASVPTPALSYTPFSADCIKEVVIIARVSRRFRFLEKTFFPNLRQKTTPSLQNSAFSFTLSHPNTTIDVQPSGD